MKQKKQYQCQSCGASFSKWAGQCGECAEWNTVVEVIAAATDDRRGRFVSDGGSAAAVQTLAEVDVAEQPRLATGLRELDRVLVELAARGGRLYIDGDIPEDRRDWLVGERMEDEDRIYTIRQPPPPGAEEDDEGGEDEGGEDEEPGEGEAPDEPEEEVPAVPAIDVPGDFAILESAFEDARPAGGFDESMTVQDVMEFVMEEASHVHIVFPPPE